MDVYTAIAARKSVRAFQDREVPEELLLRLLEAARLAHLRPATFRNGGLSWFVIQRHESD